MTNLNVPACDIKTTARSPLASGSSAPLHNGADDRQCADRIYAVGDIHGHLDLLMAMIDAIRADIEQYPDVPCSVIFLGDYIDRGPNAREVLDLLSTGLTFGRCEIVFLRGNHEQWLADFVEGAPVLNEWGPKGGLQTLQSYGLSPALILKGRFDKCLESEIREQFGAALPAAHRRFILNLKTFHSTDQYFFAHAGVDPDYDLQHQRIEDLIWIRHKFLRSRKLFGKVVVHGHTPTKAVESLPNRINVDTGVDMFGRLSCAILEADRRYCLQVYREREVEVAASPHPAEGAMIGR